MATIGKVNNIRSAHDIEWKISNFPSLFGKNGNCYCSPSFRFADEYWHLKIYPNGQESNVSNGCVSFYLARRYPGRSIRLKYVLGLKTVNGERDSEENCEYVFKETDKGFGLQCILRSKLFERRSELLPNDVLTVFCNLQYSNTAETPSENNIPVSSVHENKILEDFYDLFLKQENCDVILRVKGQDFPAHKLILTARSPVFASTFQNDMQEKKTGVVDIKDCDPSIVPDFLCFLYCKYLDNLSSQNVYSLFTAADKYDVPDLREKCIEFMKENLSVDVFCETLTLALQHSETELMESATNFFIKNAERILVTVNWQSFAAQNPMQSNELFIRFVASDRCLKV